MSDLQLNLTDDQIRTIYGTTSALIDDLVRWTGKSRATIERILLTGFDDELTPKTMGDLIK